MPLCPHCRSTMPDDARFCPECGTPHMADDVTVATSDSAATVAAATSIPSEPGSRFVPGSMIGDRYRIVGLLGRGGMGEVYRADDLKLGQAVALKFLPEGLERDADRLDRFLGEVRTARQVTHGNVCRVFDVDEIDGRHVLSMEYVDGEDLSSLLRRIGRLPRERAVEVARQICAGLAAAHDQDILHRDLKPANVMIDGRGRVKLTDFGLAGLADEISPGDVRTGTPAYLAAKQLSGREVSIRSDIYALGLVLYELFSGRPAFTAEERADPTDPRASATPSELSTHVDGLDPAVERAVLRCLETEPADRPASVAAVLAALPGGDPLAAALAAGETPSPELLAEVGASDAVHPIRAWTLALAAFLAIVGATAWAGRLSIVNHMPMEKPPAVLIDRAREMLDDLGFEEPVYADPVDTAWGMIIWWSVRDEIAAIDSTSTDWGALRERPDAGSLWYRQSPQLLMPDPRREPIFLRGPVQLTNPQPVTAGEVVMMVDLAGRLRRLQVMPKRYSTRDTMPEPDWAPLFAMAGLDTARFTDTRPRYQRYFAPDLRRAWLGTRAEAPDVVLRVEVGAFEGRPVLFNVATEVGLASLGRDPEPGRPGPGAIAMNLLQPALILVVVLFSLRLAVDNVRRSRMDRRGARRFAVFIAALFLVGNGLRSHSLFTHAWAGQIWPLIVGAVFTGFVAWAMYAAAEPLGRRVWPTMFVSFSRLLSRTRRGWRDPLIGASILVGVIAGGLMFLVSGPSRLYLETWIGSDPRGLLGVDIHMLQGTRQALGTILDAALLTLITFLKVTALVLIRMLLKRKIPATILTLVVWTLMTSSGSWLNLALGFGVSAIGMAVLLRWGMVSLLISQIVLSLCWAARSHDWGAWHGQGAAIALVILGALAAYGAWAACGGWREERGGGARWTTTR